MIRRWDAGFNTVDRLTELKICRFLVETPESSGPAEEIHVAAFRSHHRGGTTCVFDVSVSREDALELALGLLQALHER